MLRNNQLMLEILQTQLIHFRFSAVRKRCLYGQLQTDTTRRLDCAKGHALGKRHISPLQLSLILCAGCEPRSPRQTRFSDFLSFILLLKVLFCTVFQKYIKPEKKVHYCWYPYAVIKGFVCNSWWLDGLFKTLDMCHTEAVALQHAAPSM